MSVESRVSVCYGVIVSDETMKKIDNFLTDEEWDDMFDDEWFIELNSWIGGDYFLGIEKYLGNLETPLPIENLFNISDEEIKEFEAKLEKVSWRNFIDWKPKKYLINFVY